MSSIVINGCFEVTGAPARLGNNGTIVTVRPLSISSLILFLPFYRLAIFLSVGIFPAQPE